MVQYFSIIGFFSLIICQIMLKYTEYFLILKKQVLRQKSNISGAVRLIPEMIRCKKGQGLQAFNYDYDDIGAEAVCSPECLDFIYFRWVLIFVINHLNQSPSDSGTFLICTPLVALTRMRYLAFANTILYLATHEIWSYYTNSRNCQNFQT